ncbi:hypothetical protein [Methylobacillus sp. Pita1]
MLRKSFLLIVISALLLGGCCGFGPHGGHGGGPGNSERGQGGDRPAPGR